MLTPQALGCRGRKKETNPREKREISSEPQEAVLQAGTTASFIQMSEKFILPSAFLKAYLHNEDYIE